MQGEGDHPTLAAKRKGSERSGGLHGTQSGSPESGVVEWRKPGETPCARVEAGLLVGFDLEAAQRRMHSGTCGVSPLGWGVGRRGRIAFAGIG